MDIILLLKNKLLILVLLISAFALAGDKDEIKRHNLNLEQKRKLIAAVTAKITSLRKKETTLEQELRILEVSIGDNAKKVEALEKTDNKLKLKLKKHQQQAKSLQRKLDAQKTKLGKHIRLSYLTGQKNLVRMLFNHIGNRQLAKSLSLQQYIRNKHAKALDEYLEAFAKLEHKRQEIETKKSEIQNLLEEKRTTHNKLKQDVAQRFLLLDALKTKLKDHAFSLKKSTSEAKDLSDLIKKLEISIDSLPIEIKSAVQFKMLKGSLPQPVSSNKAARVSDINGVLFKVAHGAKVRAVASGRVIFADWLRGYGLLVIVDHGDGYMSLYGRNQSLYRAKGEWVQTGDLLAKVGDTGGANKSGLYFDIRLKGQSVAVLDWF